ncbi:MAG: beta-galactosidase, partial [bacterium]|nr:beta-galactosidase [bacterium]
MITTSDFGKVLRWSNGVAWALAMWAGMRGGEVGAEEVKWSEWGAWAGWGREVVEEESRTRGRVCLNGVWQFMPAEGEARQWPRGEWGGIQVPGSWKRSGAPGIVKRGRGGEWERIDEVNRGWYARRVLVPAGWQGGALVLDFRRISTDADVYVDGRSCGRVSWPGGEVEITEAVGGATNVELVVKVVATADEGLVANYMGHDQVTFEKARLESKGIIGDVYLVRRPRGARISDVFVRPSVRKRELAVDVELAEVRGGEEVECEVVCVGTNGVEAKRFYFRGKTERDGTNTMTVVGGWEDPILWEVGAPYLYRARVRVRGAGWEDEYVQEFGFRECWIEGRQIYLNGKPFRLRPVLFEDEWVRLAMPAFEGRIRGYMAAGFNIAELWPWDAYRRGRLSYRENICELASKLGFPLMGPGPSMNAYLVDSQYRVVPWSEQPKKREEFLRRAEAELRRYRNYAAVVMWSCSANFFGYDNDQEPRMLGMTNLSSVNEFKLRAAEGLRGIGMMKQIDPTRPFFTHHGSYVGEMHTCNMYLNMIPLQEREEWLSVWATNGVLPFCGIEFGTPLDATMMRGRNGYGKAMATEPWVTEFCAIYQGAEAYWKESAGYRRAIGERFMSNQVYRSWQGEVTHIETPNFQALESLFIRNTWRAWRTWGLTGGILPWMFGHGWRESAESLEQVYVGAIQPGARGPQAEYVRRGDLYRLRLPSTVLEAGRTLMEVNGAVLAWIAGSEKWFTEKGHNYRSGEEVEKTLVLINDERTAQAYRAAWWIEVGGASVCAGTNVGELGVGETKMIGVRGEVPGDVGTGGWVWGSIGLEAVIGERVLTDSFRFKVFGPSESVR